MFGFLFLLIAGLIIYDFGYQTFRSTRGRK